MKLSIGKTIKSLRKTRDITQEELAEMLGVTCQSVSRWELENSYPDIELLPAIAEIFQISVDKLLGVDDKMEQKNVQAYLDRFQAAINSGNIPECIAIARKGVAEYPNNYALLNKLMYALFVSGDDSGNIPNWQENQEKYDAEIVALGERIMKHCPDMDIRLEATGRLAFQHCEMGRRAIGRAVYESLPSQALCRENQIWWGLEAEEKLPFLRTKIRQDYESLHSYIWTLADEGFLSDRDSLEAFQKLTALDSLIFDGNDPADPWGAARINYDIAKIHARLGESEAACSRLTAAAEAARAFDDRPEVQVSHSLLLGQVEEKKLDFETTDSRSLRQIMKEKWLKNSVFDNLRDTTAFQKITEQLTH